MCICRRGSARALSLLVLLTGDVSSVLASGGDLTQRLDSLFAAIPSATFEWTNVKAMSERAALQIPVDLDGTKGWFQLDTGLDVTLLYDDVAEDHGWATYDGMYRVPSFRIGDMSLGPVWIRTREETAARGELIGSLGLDLLVGSLVVIDYPGRRLALLRHGDAPAWLWQETSWTPAVLRDAKLFLYVILGGEGVDNLVFDTGSSSFDIIVDVDDWTRFTGYDDPDRAPIQRKVDSWGKKLTAVGAPARGPLTIGSVHVADAEVFFLKEQPKLFSSWPFPARGLVGNAAFWDRVVILDLGIRPRFGVLGSGRN
jgi:hypothetical protein